MSDRPFLAFLQSLDSRVDVQALAKELTAAHLQLRLRSVMAEIGSNERRQGEVRDRLNHLIQNSHHFWWGLRSSSPLVRRVYRRRRLIVEPAAAAKVIGSAAIVGNDAAGLFRAVNGFAWLGAPGCASCRVGHVRCPPP